MIAMNGLFGTSARGTWQHLVSATQLAGHERVAALNGEGGSVEHEVELRSQNNLLNSPCTVATSRAARQFH